MSTPQISIVVPLYNEKEVFSDLIGRLDELMSRAILSIEVVMVDDGSIDNTAELIRNKCLKDNRYRGIILSRNFGHQLALSAGLANVNCTEAVMIIDGDLQDPPELLFDFYEYYKNGYEVVYAVRKKRKENYIKRLAYDIFYRIQKNLTNIAIPLDSGDFSLISRRVVDIMNQLPEESRFLRGLRAWIGYKQIGIEYERSRREKGETKYSFKKLFKLAYDGIFNFSEFPTKLITNLGIISIVISLFYLIYIIVERVFFENVPRGFTTLILAIILFSGVQLISLGLIGEYVMRIFFQVKNRPLFIIKEEIRGIDKQGNM